MSSINIELEKCGGVAANWDVRFHWKWVYENTFNVKASFQFCIIFYEGFNDTVDLFLVKMNDLSV